jgi:hypothetical protein
VKSLPRSPKPAILWRAVYKTFNIFVAGILFEGENNSSILEVSGMSALLALIS